MKVAILGAAEPDPELRARFLGELDMSLHETAGGLLAAHDVDVVLIAGIYSAWAAATVDAPDVGAYVLADKPLCTSFEQLAQIREAAARSDPGRGSRAT